MKVELTLEEMAALVRLMRDTPEDHNDAAALDDCCEKFEELLNREFMERNP